jgi:hypothetical protein
MAARSVAQAQEPRRAAEPWKQLIAQLGPPGARPSISRFSSGGFRMSKRTRYGDNSKRQQPVQQQRAEAARQATSQSKAAKSSDQQLQPQERSPDRKR